MWIQYSTILCRNMKLGKYTFIGTTNTVEVVDIVRALESGQTTRMTPSANHMCMGIYGSRSTSPWHPDWIMDCKGCPYY